MCIKYYTYMSEYNKHHISLCIYVDTKSMKFRIMV